jgi:hypothetical protein
MLKRVHRSGFTSASQKKRSMVKYPRIVLKSFADFFGTAA